MQVLLNGKEIGTAQEDQRKRPSRRRPCTHWRGLEMTPKRHIIPIFVPHLGCPNDCVFCNQRRISGARERRCGQGAKKYRRRASQNGRRRDRGRLLRRKFYGNPDREQEELLGAVLPFLRSGDISALRVSTRPDAIDDGTLSRLRKYGVETVELGVQSMDEEVLLLSGRGHTAYDAVRAAGLVKNFGFKLILQMMTGLPGDTEERRLRRRKNLYP